MDQDRLKKMYQNLLDESYDKRYVIDEFRALPTQTYDNEKNEWVPDSYSVFIMLDDSKYDLKLLTVESDERCASCVIEVSFARPG